MKPRHHKKRIIIVRDGDAWFVRCLVCSTYDFEKAESRYICKPLIAGPLDTLDEAVKAARKYLKLRAPTP